MKTHNLLLALLAAAFLSHIMAAPLCVGYKEFPALNVDCRTRTDEKNCFQGYAIQTQNLSVSCIWHELTDEETIDRQIVYNRGGTIVISDMNYQGTVCSTTVKVSLPSSSKGRWSSYVRLQSGPQNVSSYIDSTSPREAFMTSTCTLGNGAGDSCRLKNTAPKGKALTPSFRTNSALVDFYATDKDLIDQWKKNQRLHYNSTLKIKLELAGERCRDPLKYPKERPALLDEVVFGPLDYMLDEQPKKNYFLRSYRAYRIANVTGIDWSVNVTKSLDKSTNKTPLTTMLMREKDYFTWSDTCITNCTAPENLAMPHTLCKGVYCAGKIRGLGAVKGAYRLLVSYPEVSSFIWNSSFAETASVKTKYNKELVKVEILPREWSFQQNAEDQGAGKARIYMPDDEADYPLFKPPMNLGWNSDFS
jgi:hypothetical protein